MHKIHSEHLCAVVQQNKESGHDMDWSNMKPVVLENGYPKNLVKKEITKARVP